LPIFTSHSSVRIVKRRLFKNKHKASAEIA
jgi:hypothetical protein